MLISVCVKYVPDADAISRIDTGNFMVPKPEVMSFYDVHALSLALSLGGDVCIVSAGCKKDEEDCVTYLYKSLAMGVLDAVYVSGLDPIDSPQNTAFALSRGVLHLAGKYNKMPDIILCGAQSIGMANAEVPYRLASMLNLDIVPGISGLKTRKNMIQAKRQYDDMDEIIETKMPCLLMCEKNEITLPYPTLKNLMDAQEKEIPTLSAERKDVDITSPCLKSIHKCDPSRTCQMILGSSVEEKAINLLDALKKKGINLV